MKTNRVAATAVEVTALGLGTAQLGDLYDELDQGRATAIVDAAWGAGIRYFDTAPHYGLGLAECRLGMALRERSRDEFVVSSKVGRLIVAGHDGPERRWDFSADGIRQSLDDSLERLGLERIDIALIHDPAEHLRQAIDEAYPALVALKAEGVVGAIGMGTGDLGALSAFARDTEIDALMVAGRLTLLEQPAFAEVVPVCAAAGISILNAGVFNSGLLADSDPSAGAKYEYGPAPASLVERARRLAGFARAAGTTLPHLALRYAGRDRTVASVVVGADDPAQIRQTAQWAEDDRDLAALWAELERDGLLPGESEAER